MEKKDKETSKNQEKSHLKAILCGVNFLVILFVAIFLVAKEYVAKPKNKFTPPNDPKVIKPSPSPAKSAPDSPCPAPSFTADEKKKLLNQVTILESKIASLETQVTDTLERRTLQQNGLDLINAVLSAQVPLTTLKDFLKSNPVAWSNDLLKKLGQVNEVKTYVQLEEMIKQPPQQKSTFWANLKKTLTTMILIRKVNKDGNYNVTVPNDIQKALQAYDLKRALELYNKLSTEDKAALKTWASAATTRYTLEEMRKKLLQEIAER